MQSLAESIVFLFFYELIHLVFYSLSIYLQLFHTSTLLSQTSLLPDCNMTEYPGVYLIKYIGELGLPVVPMDLMHLTLFIGCVC